MNQIYLWDQDDSFEHQFKFLKEESMKTKQAKTSVAEVVFNYVRDNPGVTKKKAISNLKKSKYKASTIQTYIYQLTTVGQIMCAPDGGLYPKADTYFPLSHNKLRNARSKAREKRNEYILNAYRSGLDSLETAPPAPTPAVQHDPVNHPKHYTDGGIEVIDFIESKRLGYHLGNVVKYISRAGKKGTNQGLEDLRKAQWYLARAIEQNETEPVTR